MNQLLSLESAAEFLGIEPRYLQKLCRERKIACSRIHRTAWKFNLSELENFIQRQTIPAIPVKKLDRTPTRPVSSAPGIENIANSEALRKELRGLWQ